jgi:hypothetical protein
MACIRESVETWHRVELGGLRPVSRLLFLRRTWFLSRSPGCTRDRATLCASPVALRAPFDARNVNFLLIPIWQRKPAQAPRTV